MGLFFINWYKSSCKRVQERHFSSLKRLCEAACTAGVFHFKLDRCFHQEKQPEPGLELIETCHYIIATEDKGKNIIKMVLSSLAQGILMLNSDIYIHMSRSIWYPGFRSERIKKEFLLSMHSHSRVSQSSWVSRVLCFYRISSSVTVPWYLSWWCYRGQDGCDFCTFGESICI